MGKTNFVDGNPQQGVQGTIVNAAWLNKVFGPSGHRHDGKDADGSAAIDYAADTGAANAYVIALTPALTSHVVGMPIHFMAANANTGASTININGLGIKLSVRILTNPRLRRHKGGQDNNGSMGRRGLSDAKSDKK